MEELFNFLVASLLRQRGGERGVAGVRLPITLDTRDECTVLRISARCYPSGWNVRLYAKGDDSPWGDEPMNKNRLVGIYGELDLEEALDKLRPTLNWLEGKTDGK